jgi:SAM-dependent methyltransferase
MTSSKIEACDFDRIILEETPQAIRIAEWFRLHHKDRPILDVGCGPGIYVEAMRDTGLIAFGVDNDPRLVETEFLFRDDVADPQTLTIDADIVLSLEVGEHIPAEKANAYISFIADVDPEIIYFSAARPGQGGEGHINLQAKAYWVEKFYAAGYWLDPDATDAWLDWIRGGYHLGWLTQNGLIFKRG